MLQAFALAGSAVATVVVGKLFGKLVHRAVYRLSLLTQLPTDDQIVHRLAGPLEALAAVVTSEILISLYALPPDVLAFGRSLAQIGFLVALAWAAARVRVIDTTVEAIAECAKWIVTVSNGKLADAQIESLTARDRLRFTIEDATPAQRERVVGELNDHPQHGPEPPAVKLITGEGSRCELEVIAWFQSASWAALETLREQLLARCLEIIDAAGIGFHGAPKPALALRSAGLRSVGGLP